MNGFLFNGARVILRYGWVGIVLFAVLQVIFIGTLLGWWL